MSDFLCIQAGADAGTRFPVVEGATLVIGRGDACDVRLNDASVSRSHCRVICGGGRAILEDAGSRWGTLVNGHKVSTCELKAGDRIELGDTTLEFHRGSERKTAVEPQLPPPKAEPADDADRPMVHNLNQLVGQEFLRYRVGAVAARARSGLVFKALDVQQKRTVALKVFWPDFFADVKEKQRFLRAVRTMVGIEHENLVKLHAAGRTQGLCFTASEFVEGESATQLIQRGGVVGMLDWRKVWRIGVGVARALEFAEGRNIVHRALRPSNVLIRQSDQCVKLGDLMLARAMDDMNQSRITQRGEIVGDVHFLSPEQVQGELHIDIRADIYSLGATLYALLTGRPPFEGSPAEVIGKILTQPPTPITKHHLAVPPMFEGVVLRMLSKRADDRYRSAAAALKDITRVGKFLGLE